MSERSIVISRLLKNRSTREAYIGAKLKVLIPSQIRALRLKSQTPRQEDLANAAEMKQSRISAAETPGAVNFNLETLVRLAAALGVGLIVKFVSFSEMLKWENGYSQDAFNPLTIEKDTDFQRKESPLVGEGSDFRSVVAAGILRRGESPPSNTIVIEGNKEATVNVAGSFSIGYKIAANVDQNEKPPAGMAPQISNKLAARYMGRLQIQ